MKRFLVSAALSLCVAVPAVSLAEAPADFEDKLSYSMGYEVGNYFKNLGDDIKKDFLLQGLKDAYDGTDPALSKEDMSAIQREYGQKMQAKQKAKFEEMKTKNKEAGAKYLEENKKKDGVVTTASGLQYQVIKQGEGDKAKPTDTVKVEYVGTLIDGTEFDSTKAHGEPAEFMVNQVIAGWGEALQLMNPGTKLHLVIPAELAYGENGAAPKIEPNSVLIFDVELLSIEKE